MQVYSLLGSIDYEGQDLLSVFDSLESLMQYVQSDRGQERLRYFDDVGYVVSEFGQEIDYYGQVEYLVQDQRR